MVAHAPAIPTLCAGCLLKLERELTACPGELPVPRLSATDADALTPIGEHA